MEGLKWVVLRCVEVKGYVPASDFISALFRQIDDHPHSIAKHPHTPCLALGLPHLRLSFRAGDHIGFVALHLV